MWVGTHGNGPDCRKNDRIQGGKWRIGRGFLQKWLYSMKLVPFRAMEG